MSEERVRTLKSTKGLKKIMAKYFTLSKLAPMVGRKLAWVTAGIPIQLMYANKIYPLHPENMATVAGAQKKSLKFIEEAERQGFSRDLCSYMKTNIGSTSLNAPLKKGGIAKPDFMLSTGTICDTHIKWWTISPKKH